MGIDMSKQIVLAGQTRTVSPMPLGRLKAVIPAFNRAGKAFACEIIDEATMEDIVTIVAGGLGISPQEAEMIPASMAELVVAVDVIAEVSGLKPPPEGSPSGEAVRAVASIGTSFTPGS